MRDSHTVVKIYDLLLLEHLDPICKSEMGHSSRGTCSTAGHREENGHSDVRRSG